MHCRAAKNDSEPGHMVDYPKCSLQRAFLNKSVVYKKHFCYLCTQDHEVKIDYEK